MTSLKDKFNAWIHQDVHNLPKTGFRLNDGFVLAGDMRGRPTGDIADAVIIATDPSRESVSIQAAFEIVNMIKNSYLQASLGKGALEAVWAIHYKLYSPDQRRVMHTLVLLDILYKNCGIVFVNNWAIYLHLFRNFLERKETSQANVELAMCLVAGWQTVEVDRTYDLINTQIDSLDKVTRFFDSMMRARYPFTEESLKNIDPARIERNRASKNVMTAADFFKEGASKMNDGRDFTFKTYREGYHAV